MEITENNLKIEKDLESIIHEFAFVRATCIYFTFCLSSHLGHKALVSRYIAVSYVPHLHRILWTLLTFCFLSS